MKWDDKDVHFWTFQFRPVGFLIWLISDGTATEGPEVQFLLPIVYRTLGATHTNNL